MTILEAFAVPHPPIIIHGVGHGEEHGAQATLDAFAAVAGRIAKLQPELIILTTSHGNLYRDALSITTGAETWGDLADFRDPTDRLELRLDEDFISALILEAEKDGLPYVAGPEPRNKLDHGCMVPLLFIAQQLEASFKIARIGISFLDEKTHYHMGQCIARAVEACGLRAVLVASGDLSHRLKKDGPYGFDPAGPRFDNQITQAFARGDLEALLHFDQRLCEDAGECGLNSFIIMAGALDGVSFEPELLSYESPWGVGYGVARFSVTKGTGETGGRKVCHGVVSVDTFSRECVDRYDPMTHFDKRDRPLCHPLCHTFPVRLAFAALEDWLLGSDHPGASTPRIAALLAGLSGEDQATYEELCARQAGAFVSFHKGSDLRGCIGTIAATQDSLFEEICHNTVSAAAHDPRFPAIHADEVDDLSCSVDVLGEAEPVADRESLDAKRYGVIVTKGWRRGLLLPDLEGVDTPEQQIAIALSKASIPPHSSYELERFEVVRFE